MISAAVGIAALLAACSSSDDTAAPSTTQPESSSTSTSTEVAAVDTAFVPIVNDPDIDEHGQPVQQTCEGGEVLLDAAIDGSTVTVIEDPSGEYLCLHDELGGSTILGDTASPDVDEPRSEGSIILRHRVVHIIRLPAGYATVANVEADAVPMLLVRSEHLDYLFVIEATDEEFPDPSTPVQRELRLIAADGTDLARVPFTGPGEGGATFTDFIACVRDSGLEFPDPPRVAPGSSGTLPKVDAPIEAFDAAWAACKELFYEATRQPGAPPEHEANQRFTTECVAAAGLYPSLNQSYNEGGYLVTLGNCTLLSPAVTSLVECMRGNGLDVIIDGAPKPGPWPPDQLDPAWGACRDSYAVAQFGIPFAISVGMARADCFAENGYVSAVVVPASYADPKVLELGTQRCTNAPSIPVTVTTSPG